MKRTDSILVSELETRWEGLKEEMERNIRMDSVEVDQLKVIDDFEADVIKAEIHDKGNDTLGKISQGVEILHRQVRGKLRGSPTVSNIPFEEIRRECACE